MSQVSQLPRRVQQQLEQAEALERAANEAKAAAEAQHATGLSSLLAAPTPVQAPAAPAPPAPTPPAPDPENFETKYRTLQGKYNAEVPAMMRQANETNKQIATLTALVSELQNKAAAPAAPAADPKDVATFGDDLLDMVNRVAGTKLQEALGRIAALEQQVQGVSRQSAATLEDQFFVTLAAALPDWETINADPEFRTWILEKDPVYGIPRQAALDRARETLNAGHAVNVFKTFLGTRAAPTPAPAPAPKPAPSLESQVSPSGTGAPAPAAQPAKPIISSKAVEVFYREMAQGKWDARVAEAQSIEAQIDLAMVEGRIR